MNTYKWVISSLDAKIKDGELEKIIETVHWRYKATDGEHTAEAYGTIRLEAPEADSFIPANELTVDDVEAWLEAKLDVESLKNSLNAQIELQKNPTHINIKI
jgi:hypothetical protein